MIPPPAKMSHVKVPHLFNAREATSGERNLSSEYIQLLHQHVECAFAKLYPLLILFMMETAVVSKVYEQHPRPDRGSQAPRAQEAWAFSGLKHTYNTAGSLLGFRLFVTLIMKYWLNRSKLKSRLLKNALQEEWYH